MKEEKQKLRKLIAQEKLRQGTSMLHVFSDRILYRLETHTIFERADTVLLFHSLKDEPDTHAFIEKWSKTKRILLPVVCGEELELRMYSNQKDLIIGTYGSKEPSGEVFTDYASIDLAVVPGVAFDYSGHRLGRGKGYYDKLLPHIPAYKIGICFPHQFVEKVPADEFDGVMDEVISFKTRTFAV
ncbi:5-formyltetrahydrofolate cyclo-ligase [termite gut metagenome]|uniref:5-formyltetrahydrofolate cyclo-ligase n=1 Tax=termite gut metagenome TaxID=433724 RepID=A0A5J4RYP6_9ZZZZ